MEKSEKTYPLGQPGSRVEEVGFTSCWKGQHAWTGMSRTAGPRLADSPPLATNISLKKKKKPRPQTFQNSQNSFNHSVRFRFKGSAQPSNLGPDVDRTPLPMVASDKKRTEIKRHLK